MIEDEIKQAMGGKYHICHKCSVYDNVEFREDCRRSQPVTIGDMERHWTQGGSSIYGGIDRKAEEIAALVGGQVKLNPEGFRIKWVLERAKKLICLLGGLGGACFVMWFMIIFKINVFDFTLERYFIISFFVWAGLMISLAVILTIWSSLKENGKYFRKYI